MLEKGKLYTELGQSYIIFICTFDPYKHNKIKYTFTYKCHEVEGLMYGDFTTKIMLNTQGTEGDASNDLKDFLNAVNGIFSDSIFSTTIRKECDKIKNNREFRREYMTLEMELKEQYEAGKKQAEIEIARKMLSEGIQKENIIKLTGITEDVFKKIKDAIGE